MNKILPILISLLITTSLSAQQHIKMPATLLNKAYPMNHAQLEVMNSGAYDAPYLKQSSAFVTEDKIGETRYDNQSNASIPKKVVHFDDGTNGATWTRSMEEGSFFADRGTGYNYYDGNSWGPMPTERVENIKVHRPTYSQFGENGELIVSHDGATGLYFASRVNKGMGDWQFQGFPGPTGNPYILWNRMVTGGVDHTSIYLLALTLPSTHGGNPYMGLDGALLYSYSSDGGTTWEWQNDILDDMSSDDYTGFAGDTYAFAEPKGNTVAFVVGDPWKGLFLMKSIDGGESFDKTDIWEHPYPMWQFGTPADTFYCADGAHSAVIDNNGMVHIAFGISRVSADADGTYWYPFADGIAYWNEDMNAFSDNLNALNPYNHPESELIEDYNLIGWSQDVNNNGQLDLLDDLGLYFIGLSSMPQLVINNAGHLVLVYSSATETFDNGSKNYRHIWARESLDYGQNWGSFQHLTSNLAHIFDDCVYPSCASSMDENVYLNFQYDVEPGTAVWAAQHQYLDNSIGFIEYPVIGIGIDESREETAPKVSQNYPNPAVSETRVEVTLAERTSLGLDLFTVTGQKVFSIPTSIVNNGTHFLTLNVDQLEDGIYFYTVNAGGNNITRKMIVQKN